MNKRRAKPLQLDARLHSSRHCDTSMMPCRLGYVNVQPRRRHCSVSSDATVQLARPGVYNRGDIFTGGLVFFKHWPTFFLTFAHVAIPASKTVQYIRCIKRIKGALVAKDRQPEPRKGLVQDEIDELNCMIYTLKPGEMVTVVNYCGYKESIDKLLVL